MLGLLMRMTIGRLEGCFPTVNICLIVVWLSVCVVNLHIALAGSLIIFDWCRVLVVVVMAVELIVLLR